MSKPTLTNASTSEVATHTTAAASDKRAFFAPEGYQRLTINLPKELHKKLRLVAVEQDCTATAIIMRLLEKELGEKPLSS